MMSGDLPGRLAWIALGITAEPTRRPADGHLAEQTFDAYPRDPLGTFCQISDYPWAQRCRCAPREPICELTVPYAVLDVSSLLIDVLPAV